MALVDFYRLARFLQPQDRERSSKGDMAFVEDSQGGRKQSVCILKERVLQSNHLFRGEIGKSTHRHNHSLYVEAEIVRSGHASPNGLQHKLSEIRRTVRGPDLLRARNWEFEE